VSDAQLYRLPKLLCHIEQVEHLPDPTRFQVITWVLWQVHSGPEVEGNGMFELFSG
jgi:hypothetical protein